MSTYSLPELVAAVRADMPTRLPGVEVQFGHRRIERELILRDAAWFRYTPGADNFEPSAMSGGNPMPLWLRRVGCEVMITGRSTRDGAGIEAHRGRVQQLLHAVVGSIAVRGRQLKLSPQPRGGSGFIDDGDDENEYGAAYLFRFEIAETIFNATWSTAEPDYSLSVVALIDGIEIPAADITSA